MASRFHAILDMLQKEHEEQLASQRQVLEEELKAKQTELLAVRKLLGETEQQTAGDEQDQANCSGRDNEPISPVEDLTTHDQEGEQSAVDLCHVRFEEQDGPEEASNSEASNIEQQRMTVELKEMKEWASVRPRRRSQASMKIVFIWRRRLFVILSNPSFEILCAVAIISNAAVMGLQIDYSARHGSDPQVPPVLYRTLDYVYCFWFVLELLMKVTALGCSFFTGEEWSWNIFDTVVVSMDALQTLMDVLAMDSSYLGNLTFLRILRVLRVTRAVRIIRVVRFFRELRIMVGSVIKCGKSLMWSMLLFIAIIYVFSVLLLNAVAVHVYENPADVYYSNYRNYWRSLPGGMWTLFACMTGGVSWMEVGDPLIHIEWIWGVLLGFFMFFTIFVVTNIITGIFVDTAIQRAESDRNEIIQKDLSSREDSLESLKIVFDDLDADRSGTLNLEELESHLEDDRARSLLDAVGLHAEAARELFHLLDVDHDGILKVEEFLYGCMRLKGPATSIDLAAVKLENVKNSQVLSDIAIKLEVMQGQLEHLDIVTRDLPGKMSAEVSRRPILVSI